MAVNPWLRFATVGNTRGSPLANPRGERRCVTPVGVKATQKGRKGGEEGDIRPEGEDGSSAASRFEGDVAKLWEKCCKAERRHHQQRQTDHVSTSSMGKEEHTNGAAANDCSTSAAIAAAREAARILQPPEPPQPLAHHLEALIEAMIFNCRFLTLFAVIGSLGGSVLCFMQGCRFVKQSFFDYVHHTICGLDTSHVVILLVEAIDIFLVATVMMIFGMGVYELFINNIGIQNEDEGFLSTGHAKKHAISNLFGLFKIEVRPSWLEIRSLHELKTKVGHLVVMILLVGMFENSKKVALKTGFDLLCFSGSILFASSCLYLLSKLNVK